MENETDELIKPSTIVVVGNGLDLHCGLRSSFKNFFDSKLMYGIWYLIFALAFVLEGNKGGDIVPFVGVDNLLWMDIENCIDKVFKTRDLGGELRIYDFINNELHSKADLEEYYLCSYTKIMGDSKNQRYTIRRINELKYKLNNHEDLLMHELKKFEKDFSIYMKEQIEINKVLREIIWAKYQIKYQDAFDKACGYVEIYY